MSDPLDGHIEALLPLLRSHDAGAVAQGIELLRASPPALRDALLSRGGLSPGVAASICLGCGGRCPRWVMLALPRHRGALDALAGHDEIVSLHIALRSGADADGLALRLPPSLRSLSLKGHHAKTWRASLAGTAPKLSKLTLSQVMLGAVPALPVLSLLSLTSCPGAALAPLLTPKVTSLSVVASTTPLPPLALPTALRSLHLEKVGLTTLPPLGSALRRLNLANNPIREVPDRLGQLGDLAELVLSSCPILALPAAISGLSRLRVLRLAATGLTTLPEEVGALAALEQLLMPRTAISVLPQSLSGLERLRRLDISGTAVRALPPGGLPRLRMLSMAGAPLSLPAHAALPALRQVMVDRSQLEEVRAWAAAARRRIDVRQRH